MTPLFDNAFKMIIEVSDDHGQKYSDRLEKLLNARFFKPDKRYHFTNELITTPKIIAQETENHFFPKPKGLWYSIGEEWAEWVLSNQPEWASQYVFEVELDFSKMLCIDPPSSVENLGWKAAMSVEEFAGKFARPNKLFSAHHTANVSRLNYQRFGYENHWDLVAKEFDGVENYYLGSDFGPWDIYSGCIWNPRAVKSLKMVKDLETIPEFESPVEKRPSIYDYKDF